MVRTFFGSLATTPLPSAAAVRRPWRVSCACGIAMAAGLSLISTGCSSRDTSFSPCARSSTRSVISLPIGGPCWSLAGTILLGAVSALITGGGWLDAGRAEQRAIAEGAGGADHRQRKHGGDRHDAHAPARRRDIVVEVLFLAASSCIARVIGVRRHSRRLARPDSRAPRLRVIEIGAGGVGRRHKAGAIPAPAVARRRRGANVVGAGIGAAAGRRGRRSAARGAAPRRALSRPNSANGSFCPIRRASSASGSLADTGGGGRRAARRRFIRTIGSLDLVVRHSVPGYLSAPSLIPIAELRQARSTERDLTHFFRRFDPEQR